MCWALRTIGKTAIHKQAAVSKLLNDTFTAESSICLAMDFLRPQADRCNSAVNFAAQENKDE